MKDGINKAMEVKGGGGGFCAVGIANCVVWEIRRIITIVYYIIEGWNIVKFISGLQTYIWNYVDVMKLGEKSLI